MDPIQRNSLEVNRRHFLRECGVGVGKMAFAGLKNPQEVADVIAYLKTKQ